MKILPPREYATREEAALARKLEEHGAAMLDSIDRACRTRTAPGEAKRFRAYARTSIERAAQDGMAALAHALSETENTAPQERR